MYKQKAKMKQNKILKGSRGITLIALVITIIVLLILAGVSIASLTGKNGILTRADTARKETAKQSAKEQVQIEVLGSIGESGKVDIESLNKNLKNVQGLKYKDAELSESNKIQSLPAKVEVDEYEIEIKENGEIGIKEKEDGTGGSGGGSEVTPEEVNALIGETVDYEDKSDGKVDAWRVFYASETELFLISSNTISSSEAFGGSSGIPLQQKTTNKKYIDATNTKIVIDDVYGAKYNETYNSKWYAYGMTDMNNRSKATAYLCDSNNWKEYVGENAPSGTYAVGGPTKELLVLSWNQAVDNEGEKAPKTKAKWQEGDVVQDGYLYNKPEALYTGNPISTSILPDTINGKGLYNPGTSYWLASPSSDYPNLVCFVNDGGCVNSSGYNITRYGARPLVSIPMSKVQVKDGIVTIGSN